jgi:membrane fusion protein (multidrug efflux system)
MTFTIVSTFGCGSHEEAGSQQKQPPVKVSVITLESSEVPINIEYIAQVKSSRQVNIQARVSGFLDKRVYTEGAMVKEGDTLFLMDPKPFQAQLEQAKAALAREEANCAVARQNLTRVKSLAATKTLSQKDLDDATGQYQSAAAAVALDKAAVEQAELNLSYTTITAPMTGITSFAEQPDGTYLSPTNSQLTTVTVVSPAYIIFSVSENDWLRYRNQIIQKHLIGPKDGQFAVEVILADGSIYPHTGTVTFMNPSLDPETGTFLLRATILNPEGLLRPNQYVRIHLKGAVRPEAILVPQRAVQQSSKGHFVWVVDQESLAEQRPVVVEEMHGTQWLISEGLHPGDQVAVDGTLTLRPGAPVKAEPLAQEAAAAGEPDPGNTPAQTDR